MALSTELYKKFILGDISLDKKITAAKNLFMRGEFFYVNRKEELVLDWLLSVCNEGFYIDVWCALKDCLSSQAMKNLKVIDIKRTTKEALVELIIRSLNPSDGPVKKKKKKKNNYFLTCATNVPEQSLVRRCAILILETHVFLFYFRKNIGKYIQLSALTLKCAAENKDIATVFKCITCLRRFSEQTLNRQDTCKAFIEVILLSIINAFISIMNCESMTASCATESLKGGDTTISNEEINKLKCEILSLIKNIVFPIRSPEDIDTNLSSLFEGKSIESWSFKFLFQFLVKKTTYAADESVSYLYSFIYEAFVISFPNNFSAAYKLFVIMSLFLGFEPNLEACNAGGSRYLLESGNVSKYLRCNIIVPKREFSCPVLKNLIVILQKITVNIEETVNEVTFKQWMESLIILLVSSEKSAILYSIISSIVELNPLIVEPITSNIFKHTLLLKKETDEEKESYRNFLIGILTVFIKLCRIPNLICSNILPTLKKVIEDCRQTDRIEKLKISVSEVIPEDFGIMFGNTIGMHSGEICVTLLRMFSSILRHEIVEPLEHGEFDDGHKLQLGVVEHLLVHYLGGVRLAEQSVLKPTGIRFMDSLQELREYVGRLGIALIQHSYNAEALASFLRLSLAVGEVQLLLLVYSPWSKQQNKLQLASSTEPSCPTDFHCLLSFLSSVQWKDVSDKVSELEDRDCLDILVDLCQQKLRVLNLFGDQIEHVDEMQSSVCNYLADFIKNTQSKPWDMMFCKLSSFTLLSSFLPHEQILSLAEHMFINVSSGCVSSEIINTLRNPTMNVCVITALGWVSLKKIGLILTVKKKSGDSEQQTTIVTDIVTLLDFSDILSSKKKKGKHVLECFHLLAEKLNFSCSKVLEGLKVGGKMSPEGTGALLSCVTFLRNLPLLFLPERVQTAFALGMLEILLVLQSYSQKEKKMDGIEEGSQDPVSVRKTCFKIVQSLLEGPTPAQLGNLIDVGLCVQMLQRDGECPKAVLHLLFVVAIEKFEVLSELANAASLADEHLAKNLNKHGSPTSIVLLDILRKKNLSGLDKEVRTSYKTAIRFILQSVSRRIDEQMKSGEISENTILPLLETLCSVFSSSVEVDSILPYIDAIVSCVFSVLKNKNLTEEEVHNAEHLLEKITSNRKLVGNEICKNILLQSYKVLKAPVLTAKLLQFAVNEDFNYILNNFCKSLADKTKVKKFPDFALPKALIKISVQAPKAWKVENMVTLISSTAFKMLLEGNHDGNLQDFICFLTSVVRRPKVPLARELVDIILSTIICAMELQPYSVKYTVATVTDVVPLLTSIMIYHFPLLEDRIPAFMSAFHSVIHCVVVNSSVDIHHEAEEIEGLAKCALRVEQLSKVMTQHSDHFRLISQFIVADLLLELERTTIHHEVKIHVMNTMYAFMDLCDDFAIAHLSQALSPASMELFKNILSNYKKFYRYTGRV